MYSVVGTAFLSPLSVPFCHTLLAFVRAMGRTVWQTPAGEESLFRLQSVRPLTLILRGCTVTVLICVCIALAL